MSNLNFSFELDNNYLLLKKKIAQIQIYVIKDQMIAYNFMRYFCICYIKLNFLFLTKNFLFL